MGYPSHLGGEAVLRRLIYMTGRDVRSSNRTAPLSHASSAHPNHGGRTMSRSINKIILVGHVGRDPDIQTTASGTRGCQRN